MDRVKQHNGINVPLFSLHSQNSSGIGEFTDLIPLISWCKEVSFDVIQLLPLNDTGQQTSPYSAISAFALNPIHLGLKFLPSINDDLKLQEILTKAQKLNASERVDYKAVQALKNEFLKSYYEKVGLEVINSENFKIFLQENPWAYPYALYKHLSIINDWQSFEHYENELKNPTLLTYMRLLESYKNEIDFHIFVQYLCFKQFKEVKAIATANQILLMGDIPILINRDSADVYLQRNLFNMSYSAGAPPDQYSSDGQNWGFPTYNWDQAEKEEWQWWKLRLKVASRLYDIYRIDHIIGFFRIWSIPYGMSGKNGHYVPDNFDLALIQGEKILKIMLESSPMLAIGEDLGNVSDEIREVMKKLEIPGTKVMRWERVWNEDRRFIEIKNYPILSLTTVSTHDSEPLALWWRDKKDEAIDYAKSKGFDYQEFITKEQQISILKDSLHTSSLFHINLLQEYLSLIKGFTSDNLDDERINIPGSISDQNWTYRYKKSVEEIVNNDDLKKLLQILIK